MDEKSEKRYCKLKAKWDKSVLNGTTYVNEDGTVTTSLSLEENKEFQFCANDPGRSIAKQS